MAEGFLGRMGRTLTNGGKSRADGQGSLEGATETRSAEEWKRHLTPEQYRVLREHGTERAFTSPLDKTYDPGVYHCAGCGQPLFSSDAKYNSGSGWPSFSAPLDEAVGVETDNRHFMSRTEVHCQRCHGHLGHVFEDGPQPTGLRYCMNGAALDFHSGEKVDGLAADPNGRFPVREEPE